MHMSRTALSCLLLATSLIACGPESEKGETDSETGADTGENATSAGGELEGFEFHEVEHVYYCLSGCGISRSNRLNFWLKSDAAMDVTIAWHDWTVDDRELSLDPTPYVTEEFELEAGALTPIELDYRREQHCDEPEGWWDVPARALITVDDVPIELVANSQGGMGYDHCPSDTE